MTISDFGATRERGRALDMGGSARYADGMPEDPEEQKQSEKPSSDTEEGKVRIPLSGTATASAQIRVRLIQQSPTADPKLVEAARKYAQKLKEKEGDEEKRIDHIPEAPLILPVPQE
jgi:hypothetical protein